MMMVPSPSLFFLLLLLLLLLQGLESMGLLEGTVTTPLGFVGHSLGALLGYEVVRYLKKERSCDVAFFVVGGTRAPQVRGGRVMVNDPVVWRKGGGEGGQYLCLVT